MKAKKELANLKRDLARLYRATGKERAAAAESLEALAFLNGAMAAAAMLIKKYKIEV